MAKKETRDDWDEGPEDPNDSNTNADSPDEVHRRGDQPEYSGESTLVPETPSVPAPEASGDDADGTVRNLDSTIRIAPEDRNDGSTAEIDPSARTVASGDVDKTLALDASQQDPRRPVIHRSGNRPEPPARAPDPQTDSTINLGDPTTAKTVPSSIMTSSEIGKTVNPRELSDRDATLWSSAVGDQSSDPTVLPPAIERSYSEQQLELLRRCDVAPLKSDPDKSSDYRLVRRLGQGGMGDVFVARQGSLDRLLALKLIKPIRGKKREQLMKTGKLATVEEERRQQFLSEAIVTGDLDHPNIVPIHDVALTSNNELFYAMKRVVGTPWSEVIKDKSRDENLEILLKAADAIGFAHTRGVVHRDIKPENIMLGDFGVVMVMDWGLALPTSEYEKQESIFSTSGLGGTPAFMAPEMATGPLNQIGPAADIYLLGATLFMVVTGHAPHHAKNVTECLRAVRENRIRDVPEEKQGELLEIALKAMSADPRDRYPDVESFQRAIRDYRSHAESISLAVRAAEDLDRGKRTRSYSDFSRAAFRFEEAIKFWEGNEKAHEGLAETRLLHARAAYDNGDFDLGLSLLDDSLPEHQRLLYDLRQGLRERESRDSRLSVLRKLAAAMLAVIIIGGSVAMYVINSKYREAQQARDAARIALAGEEQAKIDALASAASEARAKEDALEAARQEQEAKQTALAALQREEQAKQKAIASAAAEEQAKNDALIAAEMEKDAKVKAEQSRREAESARDAARLAQRQAEALRKRAQYEEYVSKIGLAKARLERNEADGAREILQQLRDSATLRSDDTWEWRWLWRQANQSESSERSDAAVLDLSLGTTGRRGAVALNHGGVDRFTITDDAKLAGRNSLALPGGNRATSVAHSPDESVIAVGTEAGDILLIDSDGAVKKLTSHQDRVNDLQFTADGLLVSASDDRTIRAWDISTGVELTSKNACWHISPVVQIAVTGTASSMTVAAAISDDSSGRIAVWDLRREGREMLVQRRGTVVEHRLPVTAVALSADGRLAASGDVEGNLLVWEPAKVRSVDHGESIRDALAELDGRGATRPRSPANLQFDRLVDASFSRERLVSARPNGDRRPRAHVDVVKSIRFSRDGRFLLTASDDYTLKVWDVAARRLNKTLKGHGGWVVGAEFVAGGDGAVVSASNDATIRTWKPDKYVGAFVMQTIDDDPAKPGLRRTEAHEDEILSASFSRDAAKVVTASHDHTARVMDIDPDSLAFVNEVRLQDELLEEGTSFVAMAVHVDRPHNRLYVGSADATIRVWDLQRGTEIAEATGTGLNTSFAVSSDGRRMLTGSSSPEINALLWELDPGGTSPPRIVHRLKGHDQTVTAFAISPDSSLLFTGDRTGLGIMWDVATGKQVGDPVEDARGYRINAAGFSADGRNLLIAADDEQLTMIDVGNRRRLARMNHEGFVTGLSLSPDGRHAITLSELATGRRIESVATLWDLVTATPQVLDRVVEQRDGERESSSANERRRITSARFDQAGRIAVVSRAAVNGDPATVQVWKINREPTRPSDRLTLTRLDSPPIRSDRPAAALVRAYQLPGILGTAEMAVPIDEATLLTMNKNGAFKWDLRSNQLVKSFRAHAELTEASFSFDSRFVATASRSVKIWDAATGKSLAKIESRRPVRSVQFAPLAVGPSSYLLVTAGDEGVAQLWQWNPESATVTPLERYDVDGDDPVVIRRVRFSTEADHVWIVGDRGTARLWNRARAAESMVLDDPRAGELRCGAVSRDGKYVVAGGTDKNVRIWRIPKPGEAASAPILLSGHADVVQDVALLGSSVAMRVMTASADDSTRVWDPRLGATDAEGNHPGGREILTLRQHAGDVNAVDVTDDGSLMMTAGRDGNVILWPADPPPPNLFDAF